MLIKSLFAGTFMFYMLENCYQSQNIIFIIALTAELIFVATGGRGIFFWAA